MKHRKLFSWRVAIFGCGFLTVMGACSQDDPSLVSDAYPIYLSGSMGDSGVSASTRTPLDGSSTDAINVSFARRDQGTDGAYPSYTTIASSLNAVRAAVAGNTAGAITFASGSEQYYLVRETNNSTALIGWYPQVGAGSAYAAGVITFSGLANGVTDIMLTKEQAGNKSTAVGAFTFEHVLAQIQVKAKAVDASAATNWGKITGITLKGVNTTCAVTLPTTGTLASTLITPTFGTSGNIALKAIGSDTQTALTAVIPATAGTTGTAFCYGLFPPTGGNTLTLDVATEKGGVRSVTATLGSGTVVKGNIYTVTLEFKSTDITPTATISSWGTGSGANVEM